MQPIAKSNPLANFMRQPKIYIKLPTGGTYWPPKSIDIPESGELPVYSMTAKDELLFKTPDALLNGQAIVDVVHSCVPSIKNAWAMPVLDLDTVLIAIRLATYGERMTVKVKIPVVNEDIEYEVDLRILLDQKLSNVTWEESIKISDDITVLVRPLTYKHMSQTSMKAFETQRIMNMVNDDKISDDQKLSMFSTSFNNLTQVTVDLISDSIFQVTTPAGDVTDKNHIKEFIANSDKTVFDTIKNHLDELKKANELKPLTAHSTEEQQAAGAPATYEIPIGFNNSDFFEQGF